MGQMSVLGAMIACAQTPISVAPPENVPLETVDSVRQMPKRANRRRQSVHKKRKLSADKSKRRGLASKRRQRMRVLMKRFQSLSPVVVSDRKVRQPLPSARQDLWSQLLRQAGAWAARARGKQDQRFAAFLANWLEDQLALEKRQYTRDRILELNIREMIRFCAARGEVANLQRTAVNRPLVWPLNKVVVTSFFGPRKNPFGKGTRQHDGIDFSAAVGTPVYAIAGGNVTRAGVVGGFGRLIEIDHGQGLVSRYAHLSESKLSRGDAVAPGSQIGQSGRTGRVTGPHLHFEVRLNGAAVDPLLLLGWRTRVRP